jgi:hypothetical protein
MAGEVSWAETLAGWNHAERRRPGAVFIEDLAGMISGFSSPRYNHC